MLSIVSPAQRVPKDHPPWLMKTTDGFRKTRFKGRDKTLGMDCRRQRTTLTRMAKLMPQWAPA